MQQPKVTMVALYRDTPQFTERMLASFRSQSYEPKRLLVYDNGEKQLDFALGEGERIVWEHTSQRRTVGALRNAANGYTESDIIAHLDMDDWSHPERIAEQVALLQASGKECVGYRDMLFWRAQSAMYLEEVAAGLTGQAWLYSHGKPSYCLGTSLCYWRRVWERRPFEDVAHGEDTRWLMGVDSLGVTAVKPPILPYGNDIDYGQRYPRMIASIHRGNTSPAYQHLEACQAQGEKWKRVPVWDSYCRGIMEGACSSHGG